MNGDMGGGNRDNISVDAMNLIKVVEVVQAASQQAMVAVRKRQGGGVVLVDEAVKISNC